MKLPPNILRAMDRLEESAQANVWELTLRRMAALLRELRLYHAEKAVDQESTHAMRRVKS